MGLRKETMKEVWMLLLKEENLTLDKAEEMVKLYEFNLRMMQGKNFGHQQISQLQYYTCGKMGHMARKCRKRDAPMDYSRNNGGYRRNEGDGERRKDTIVTRNFDSTGEAKGNGCFIYQETGHWAKHCPQKKFGGGSGARNTYESRKNESGYSVRDPRYEGRYNRAEDRHRPRNETDLVERRRHERSTVNDRNNSVHFSKEAEYFGGDRQSPQREANKNLN